jgi:hypothetical protein
MKKIRTWNCCKIVKLWFFLCYQFYMISVLFYHFIFIFCMINIYWFVKSYHKTCYYYNFNTWLEGWLGHDSSHWSGGSTRDDPSQHINKNNNYYNFKIQFENLLEQDPNHMYVVSTRRGVEYSLYRYM